MNYTHRATCIDTQYSILKHKKQTWSWIKFHQTALLDLAKPSVYISHRSSNMAILGCSNNRIPIISESNDIRLYIKLCQMNLENRTQENCKVKMTSYQFLIFFTNKKRKFKNIISNYLYLDVHRTNNLSIWDDDDDPIRVTAGGTVIWNHISSYVTSCESDVTFYPFDTQRYVNSGGKSRVTSGATVTVTRKRISSYLISCEPDCR